MALKGSIVRASVILCLRTTRWVASAGGLRGTIGAERRVCTYLAFGKLAYTKALCSSFSSEMREDLLRCECHYDRGEERACQH